MAKSKIKNAVKIAILAVLLFVGAFVGVKDAKNYGLSLFAEQKFTVEIDEERDFKEMRNSFHNNDCFLTADIETESTQALANNQFPFVGTFDGQGHVIRVKNGLSQSFFGYIGKEGVVKNLTIIVEGESNANEEFAVFAVENEGKIVNCKIVTENIKINGLGTYAGVCVYNHGIIQNVYADCKFTKALNEEAKADDTIGKIKAGGICAYNYGDLINDISLVQFEQFKEVLKSEQYVDNTYNAYIGALVGVDNGSVQTCLVCVDESVCVSDEKNESVYFRTKEEILDADLLFNAMLFDQEHWEFVGEKGVGELRTKGAK